MRAVESGSGTFPVNFHTRWLCWARGPAFILLIFTQHGSFDMSLCVAAAQAHMCAFPCALICVLSYVFFPLCALLCVLSFVLSHVCSHMCAVICVLSYVCSHMSAFVCVLPCLFSDMCSHMSAPLCSHLRVIIIIIFFFIIIITIIITTTTSLVSFCPPTLFRVSCRDN